MYIIAGLSSKFDEPSEGGQIVLAFIKNSQNPKHVKLKDTTGLVIE